MGLDNGIEIKNRVIADEMNLNSLYENLYDEYYEVCYWRKWWGLRNDFVDYLSDKYNNYDEPGYWELDLSDLESLVILLKKWDNKDYWEDNEGSPIWFFDEDNIHEHITSDIERISFLINLKDFDKLGVVFYDSY